MTTTNADALADAIQAEKAARAEYRRLEQEYQRLRRLMALQSDRIRTAHAYVVELEAWWRNEA